MNVRVKLLISQSLSVILILGFSIVAVVVAQRFDYQLRRAELAYDQRQTMTMLAVQAFRYKTVIDQSVVAGHGRSADLELARDEIRTTLALLATQTEEELAFVGSDLRAFEAAERERLGELNAVFAAIDSLVDRIIELDRIGSGEGVRLLHDVIEQRFEGEIAEILAAAMADEVREVVEADARIDELASRRVQFLIAAGVSALVIILAMGLVLHRSISRPMRELLVGVRAIKAGNLHHRVHIGGKDEFAQLASQFNDMSANLEDRERRLLTAQSDLEQQVAQRTTELAAANQRLKYLDRRRLLFLADVSHELRTPVTVLRGEADVTLRAQPTSVDAYRDSLARISRQAEQMGRMIDDLLFLVRTEADTVTFDWQRVDLQDVVADAVSDGSVLAQGKRIAVTQKLPGEPIWVTADAQRLRQAVLIAIDNAIKYSASESAVEVSLEIGDKQAAIAVLDHGAGVPPEELPFVFERFYRIRSGSKRRPDGSGLGLPIAKWITEKHAGTIALDSTPGEETRLTIRLPTAQADAP
jgi:two-component system, OmpR family, sensor kinase